MPTTIRMAERYINNNLQIEDPEYSAKAAKYLSKLLNSSRSVQKHLPLSTSQPPQSQKDTDSAYHTIHHDYPSQSSHQKSFKSVRDLPPQDTIASVKQFVNQNLPDLQTSDVNTLVGLQKNKVFKNDLYFRK